MPPLNQSQFSKDDILYIYGHSKIIRIGDSTFRIELYDTDTDLDDTDTDPKITIELSKVVC